jgi:glycosyltransferase involved in cell wall biosynthesis
MGEAVLVVKTNNVNGLPHFREQSNKIKKLAEGLRVLFIEETLTAKEMKSLYHHCDCYVSLHRSEGMGLGIPNAMYNRKPVIVTYYSGPVDYVTEETTYPVKYTLKTIESDLGPYTKGNHWADADVDQAAQYMVDVYSNRKTAQIKAQHAHEHIREMYSPSKTGQHVRERLEKIWRLREGINFYNSFKQRNYGQKAPQ